MDRMGEDRRQERRRGEREGKYGIGIWESTRVDQAADGGGGRLRFEFRLGFLIRASCLCCGGSVGLWDLKAASGLVCCDCTVIRWFEMGGWYEEEEAVI